MIWFNSVKNDDLKFRIVRSLDGLLKVEHIQFLQNTIDITKDQRDLRILNNLLQPLESKINIKNKQSNLRNSKSNQKSFKDSIDRHLKILLFLTSSSVFISLLILYNHQPVNMIGDEKLKIQGDKVTKSSVNLDQCDAQILSLDPVKIHCDGIIIKVTNPSKNWQKYWPGESIKVKLLDIKSSSLNPMHHSAIVKKVNEISIQNELPTIGEKFN